MGSPSRSIAVACKYIAPGTLVEVVGEDKTTFVGARSARITIAFVFRELNPAAFVIEAMRL